MPSKPKVFIERQRLEPLRENDWRTQYSRDRARIIHGAAFRRLQGKTQVMGAGEGDFHRTRLTHTLEVAQIALGIFQGFKKGKLGTVPGELKGYLDNARPVISAACYAHDLGHPPFGHGGERALHQRMLKHGGFEGNAQTIRILTRLEKYHEGEGINPTRRVLLSVLKYPVDYEDYPDLVPFKKKPPKCYYQSDRPAIDWALSPFVSEDQDLFRSLSEADKPKPLHMTFDASVMECADDIAYCTHDLEDIIARGLVDKDTLLEAFRELFKDEQELTWGKASISYNDFEEMFKDSFTRKKMVGKLANFLITSVELVELKEFSHPLLKYRLRTNHTYEAFIDYLKKEITFKLVVARPAVQMLEKKGQRLITCLFREYKKDPEALIPNWETFQPEETPERRICDYIAGMTDAYAEKIYHRMFTPGVGSSRDEL
jgi:dGTPase